VIVNVWASVPVTTVEKVKESRETLQTSAREPVKGDTSKESISQELAKALVADNLEADLRSVATVSSKQRRLLDLYYPEKEFDSAIAELQKDPEIQILGVWNWDGRVRPGFSVDKEAIRAFMPDRFDADGAPIGDDAPTDVITRYGQTPREFG
jgi:hypothetical protein